MFKNVERCIYVYSDSCKDVTKYALILTLIVNNILLMIKPPAADQVFFQYQLMNRKLKIKMKNTIVYGIRTFMNSINEFEDMFLRTKYWVTSNNHYAKTDWHLQVLIQERLYQYFETSALCIYCIICIFVALAMFFIIRYLDKTR